MPTFDKKNVQSGSLHRCLRRDLALAAAAMLRADIDLVDDETEQCTAWLHLMTEDASFSCRTAAIDILAGMRHVWTEVQLVLLQATGVRVVICIANRGSRRHLHDDDLVACM